MDRRDVGTCILPSSTVRAHGSTAPDPPILGERHFGLPYPHPDATVARVGLAADTSHRLRTWILLS